MRENAAFPPFFQSFAAFLPARKCTFLLCSPLPPENAAFRLCSPRACQKMQPLLLSFQPSAYVLLVPARKCSLSSFLFSLPPVFSSCPPENEAFRLFRLCSPPARQKMQPLLLSFQPSAHVLLLPARK
jgi:hypothetical protein